MRFYFAGSDGCPKYIRPELHTLACVLLTYHKLSKSKGNKVDKRFKAVVKAKKGKQ